MVYGIILQLLVSYDSDEVSYGIMLASLNAQCNGYLNYLLFLSRERYRQIWLI
jgi:hypothetical protein